MSFSTIQVTAKGRALLARAQTGTIIKFTRIKMGDGLIGSRVIDEMTDVISQKANLSITALKVLSGGKAKLSAAYTNQGLTEGFYWRELAVFAEDPDDNTKEIMYCYGNAGALADYIPAEGSQILEKVISVQTIISNASSVTALIDSSNIYVTTQEFGELVTTVATAQATADDAVSASAAAQNTANSAVAAANTNTANLNSHLSDYVRQPGYGATTGSVNTYTLALSPAPTTYVDGMGIVVKIHVANTGASTINLNGLGAKAIVDSKGNALTSGKLRLNGTYSLKYNSTTGNFILQGSDSSGNATPADLLAGKTASTDTGDITGTIPSKGAATYSPSTTVQTISAGQYLSGVQTIAAVAGTATPDKVDSGYTFSSANGINLIGTSTKKRWAYVDVWLGSHNVAPPFVVTGLGFMPSTIIVLCETTINSDAYQITAVYSKDIYQSIATLARYKSVTYGDSYTSYQAIIPTWSVGAGTFSFSAGSHGFTSVKYWAFE